MNSSRLAVPVRPLASDFRRSLSIAREFGVRGIEIDGRHGTHLSRNAIANILVRDSCSR